MLIIYHYILLIHNWRYIDAVTIMIRTSICYEQQIDHDENDLAYVDRNCKLKTFKV